MAWGHVSDEAARRACRVRRRTTERRVDLRAKRQPCRRMVANVMLLALAQRCGVAARVEGAAGGEELARSGKC